MTDDLVKLIEENLYNGGCWLGCWLCGESSSITYRSATFKTKDRTICTDCLAQFKVEDGRVVLR